MPLPWDKMSVTPRASLRWEGKCHAKHHTCRHDDDRDDTSPWACSPEPTYYQVPEYDAGTTWGLVRYHGKRLPTRRVRPPSSELSVAHQTFSGGWYITPPISHTKAIYCFLQITFFGAKHVVFGICRFFNQHGIEIRNVLVQMPSTAPAPG